MFYIILGKRIRDIRLYRNYSVRELAEAANISEKFLYRIEEGKSGFSARVLYNIAMALEVDSGYILNKNSSISNTLLLETINRFSKEEQRAIEKVLFEIKRIKNNYE